MQRMIQIFQVFFFRIQNDLCFLRASALAFAASLSVVPIFAVMFGIAKGFGLETILETAIRSEFKDQEEMIKYLIDFSYTLLEHTRGGLIVGIGLLALFYTVLNMLSTIEDALNYMWGIKIARSLGRKIIDFLALILLCPILLILSSSLTVFMYTVIESMHQDLPFVSQIKPIILHSLSFAPYFVCILLFTFLYLYMPNCKVRISSALIAGVLAGTAFQVLQGWYIFLQIQLTRVGTIYGSFAAIPLFLLWLYISWIIFLFGAEVLVIHQEKLWNPHILAPYRRLNRFEKKLVLLSIVKTTVDAYIEHSPLTTRKIAEMLKLPIRLAFSLVNELVDAKLLLITEETLVPAKNPEALTLAETIEKIEGKNVLMPTEEMPFVTSFERILTIQNESNTALLKDIS